MDTNSNKIESKQETNVGAFDFNNMQCLIIVNRLKSLALTLSYLAEEPEECSSKLNVNTKTKLQISSFWSCQAHFSCTDCEVCCSCVLKMFLEMHLLSERDIVGNNYVAITNIIKGLMKKLAYQDELLKKRREAEENRKKTNQQKRESRKKSAPSVPIEETINWPDDLSDLITNWDNLPENRGKNMIKTITQSEMEQLLRPIVELNQHQPANINQVMRGWPAHRQAMIARPMISQLNNRTFINRRVVPRPMVTQQINTGGRQLMSHINLSSGRHVMSHVVTGRPILSRVISGHSLMGHMVTAQSLMNHTYIGSNRNIMCGATNSRGAQMMQNNLPGQLSQNLTFVNYNPTLQPRSTDHHSNSTNNNNNKRKLL